MQGDGGEEGGRGGQEVWRWRRVETEGVVEVIGCADGEGVEGSRVREDGVAEMVPA